MQLIVISRKHGGFGLSGAGKILYAEKTSSNSNDIVDRDIARDDPMLVEVVEELGKAAGDQHSSLAVVEIPDGIDWEINEDDGDEWVAEKHQTWP